MYPTSFKFTYVIFGRLEVRMVLTPLLMLYTWPRITLFSAVSLLTHLTHKILSLTEDSLSSTSRINPSIDIITSNPRGKKYLNPCPNSRTHGSLRKAERI